MREERERLLADLERERERADREQERAEELLSQLWAFRRPWWRRMFGG